MLLNDVVLLFFCSVILWDFVVIGVVPSEILTSYFIHLSRSLVLLFSRSLVLSFSRSLDFSFSLTPQNELGAATLRAQRVGAF